MILNKLLSKYDEIKLNKIKDFILSEIHEDTIKETENFINCKLSDRKNKFNDLLYEGENYVGVFLEGNQYLISEEDNIVIIIDFISEENGVGRDLTRFELSTEDFLVLINNKEQVLKFEKYN